MRIYVINLERRPDRRPGIEQQLSELNLSPTWVRAVDGHAHDFGAVHQAVLMQSGLRHTELACYLSHLATWQTVIDADDDHAVVLEDDAIIGHDFLSVTQSLVQWLPRIPLIRLSALQKQVGHTIADIDHAHRLVLPTKSVSGTQGYLVSRHGARRLLTQLNDIRLPIDTALDRYWLLNTPIGVVTPPLVGEDGDSPSDIAEAGRRDVSRDHRLIPRIKDSLRKRMGILTMYARIKGQRAAP